MLLFDNERQAQSELSELPVHVERYRALLLRHNDLASKRKRSEVEEQEKDEIKQKLLHYMDGLSSVEQQKDIENFVLRVTHAKVIADEAGKTHERVVRTMHWLPRTMKIFADVFPPLCGETARLALSTVGLTLVGLGHGIKTTAKALQNLFFGHTA